MIENNFSTIGYLTKCDKKVVSLLTPAGLENLQTSTQVEATMAEIEATTDQEKKGELKKQLPCIFYMCQMPEDGSRPKADTAKPSGLCMHDWDHMDEDPSAFYFQHIAGREKELSIVFAHITPRGQGLRLVTKMNACETISQCQERIAKMFGMEKYADFKCKDLSRMSFLPSKKYELYKDNEGLFEHEAPVSNEKAEDVKKDTSNIKEVETTTTEAKATETQQTVSNTKTAMPCLAELFKYDEVKFSDIIKSLLERIATQGEPREGERNDDLFKVARELRHICDYNFNTVYNLLAPYFPTLQDAEIRRCISNAIATNGRTITPMLKGVLNELKNQNVESDANDDFELARLPKVSPIMETILSKFPSNLRNQVFMASLPIWAQYSTHVHFNYLDNRENTCTFLTVVVGKSASGKAFAAHLYKMMVPILEEKDAKERAKYNEYLASCKRKGDGAEKPEEPKPKIRIWPGDISKSQALDYMENLDGEHALVYSEEIDTLTQSRKSHYGLTDDFYRKAFDNGIDGKESKSQLTRNIRTAIYANLLTCGTIAAAHNFFNNPEGGLNNRIIFDFMPTKRNKNIPVYNDFTEEERKEYDEICNRLWETGKDGKKVVLPWLNDTILKINKEWIKEDEENPNEVLYDLGKRAMVVAFRVGVLEWLLRGCPDDKSQIKEMRKVVKWMANAMRQSVYAFSGKDYEEIAEQDNALQKQIASRMGKNTKLFSLLPDEFTTQQVIDLRVQNGQSTNVGMVIKRWSDEGKIRSTSWGHYHKVG